MLYKLKKSHLYRVNDDILKWMGAVVGGAVVYIATHIAQWWKGKRDKKLSSNGIEQFNETDKVVRHSAVHCFIEHLASRVFVMHFTNGTRTEAGVHLQKLTLMHERTREATIEKITPYHSAIPLQDFWYHPIKIVRSSKDKDYYVAAKNEIRESNSELYDWMDRFAIESMYMIGVRNKMDIVVAIFCIHFETINSLNERSKFDLKQERNKIESVYNALK